MPARTNSPRTTAGPIAFTGLAVSVGYESLLLKSSLVAILATVVVIGGTVVGSPVYRVPDPVATFKRS